jgi:hypothetical protein
MIEYFMVEGCTIIMDVVRWMKEGLVCVEYVYQFSLLSGIHDTTVNGASYIDKGIAVLFPTILLVRSIFWKSKGIRRAITRAGVSRCAHDGGCSDSFAEANQLRIHQESLEYEDEHNDNEIIRRSNLHRVSGFRREGHADVT